MGTELSRMMQGCIPAINPESYDGLQTTETVLYDLERGIVLLGTQQDSNQEKSVQSKARALRFKQNGNKDAAITAMKESKQYSAISMRISSHKMVLEGVKNSIETAAVSKDIAHVLRRCSETLKTMTKDVSVDNIDEMMEQLGNQAQDINLISESLGTNIEAGSGGPLDVSTFDDEDLWAELENIESNPGEHAEVLSVSTKKITPQHQSIKGEEECKTGGDYVVGDDDDNDVDVVIGSDINIRGKVDYSSMLKSLPSPPPVNSFYSTSKKEREHRVIKPRLKIPDQQRYGSSSSSSSSLAPTKKSQLPIRPRNRLRGTPVVTNKRHVRTKTTPIPEYQELELT